MTDLLAGMRSGPWLMEEVRWDDNHPRAAPQFRCHECRRWIAKTRSLILLNADDPGESPVLLCLRCMDRPTPRQAHAHWYPDCPEKWHDMFDHRGHCWGTRAAIAHVLGLWP